MKKPKKYYQSDASQKHITTTNLTSRKKSQRTPGIKTKKLGKKQTERIIWNLKKKKMNEYASNKMQEQQQDLCGENY